MGALSLLNPEWQKKERKKKEPPSHYMNFDPRQGQHMHDLCQRSTCQFHVCLLSFFSFHYFLFFKKNIFCNVRFRPSLCVCVWWCWWCVWWCICVNWPVVCIAATLYLSIMGKEGIQKGKRNGECGLVDLWCSVWAILHTNCSRVSPQSLKLLMHRLSIGRDGNPSTMAHE